MDELASERVLRAVECIPPGSVAAYGDLARATGTSPRFAARVMSTYGGGVPWWRVPNAKGELPPALARSALPHWEEEGTPLVRAEAPHSSSTAAEAALSFVRMRAARVDPDEFAASVAAAIAELEDLEPSDDSHGRRGSCN